jgi:hypothetical protein
MTKIAESCVQTREWLANAMQSSWDIAAVLIGIEGLEDLLGDRHRIIANDWLAADAPPTSAVARPAWSTTAGLVDNERRWRVFPRTTRPHHRGSFCDLALR